VVERPTSEKEREVFMHDDQTTRKRIEAMRERARLNPQPPAKLGTASFDLNVSERSESEQVADEIVRRLFDLGFSAVYVTYDGGNSAEVEYWYNDKPCQYQELLASAKARGDG
jgi:hypothetical protein